MTDISTGPIEACVERWHRHLAGDLPGGLDELLHEDVVFTSPIVFTPQLGRDITKLYLTAAGGTIGGGQLNAEERATQKAEGKGFRYTREIMQGHHAMLEFETEMDGKYVNGVDIITCDDDGAIIDFKVMIRPLQAINLVHAQMQEMLARLSQ